MALIELSNLDQTGLCRRDTYAMGKSKEEP